MVLTNLESRSNILDYESDYYYTVNTVNNGDKQELFAKMIINQNNVDFQIDTGATCNLIPERIVEGRNLNPTTSVCTTVQL